MNKVAVIYSFKATKSAQVAKKILSELGDKAEAVNVDELTDEQFLSYSNIICGAPTWFDGELPTYWDEFLPMLDDVDLKGKKVAFYGLGDQKGYPENFLDAIGILADFMEDKGAEIIGFTSREGFVYESSKAERDDNKFVGLAIDFENNARKINSQVKAWVKDLKPVFN